jgi:UDP-galactopyranose mutase
MYDYLIVGAGLYGSIVARELTDRGKKCLVIDKRNHIGGNIYTEKKHNIYIHKYGAHIFHTNNKDVWDYINKFDKFNSFINEPIAIYKNKVYNLPFNMNTFTKIWKNTNTPKKVLDKINKQKRKIKKITNLEEQAISMVGKDVYKILIKGYTEKQWGKKCKKLPASIIKRLPVRLTYNNNYFNAKFQGIPEHGYTTIIQNMLKGIDVKLNRDYIKNKEYYNNKCKKIIYTGQIDAYYDYIYGKLEYRSLRFQEETLNVENFQGNAVINYTEKRIPYTRIIEHKHFANCISKKTIITKEYPCKYDGENAYYPINDKKNEKLYQKYAKIKNDKVIFAGRLGQYKYFDMDKTIEEAFKLIKQLGE